MTSEGNPAIFSVLKNHRILFPAVLAVGGALLAGCAQTPSFQLEKTLPESNAIPGWTATGKVQTYTPKTLFDYIDGSSEYYFTYFFEETAVNRYEKTGGGALNAEVWQFADAKDAYGLFSGRTGGEALTIGGANEAALEKGSQLLFWQDRFYVNLAALTAVPDADLRRFAEFISKALPTGGEKPELVGRLPADGLIPGSIKFFHMELAVQDRLWLGGENLLGLALDTDAAVARYLSGGTEWQLLLVQYPDTARAEAGVSALRNGALEEFIAADTNGPLVGALFGRGDGDAAEILLAKALGK